MPELPEVEHLRRSLESWIQGARIRNVHLERLDVLDWRASPGTLKSDRNQALLQGGRISCLDRHGKQMAIHTEDGRVLCVHLGMSGRMEIARAEDELPAHTHCVWDLLAGRRRIQMRFVDPRRFGGLWTFRSRQKLLSDRWGALGPDAVSLDPESMAQQLRGRSRGLKASLLDQSVVAGLGNIYVDEALFESKLHPRQPAGSLKQVEIGRLTTSVVGILRRAIKEGGSTIHTWADLTGDPGGFSTQHQVYGRGGEMCTTCGQRLSSAQVVQRTTVWCSKCQTIKRRKRWEI
ncbi:MAG: hypothetical protein CMJ39_08285 [Phycisphaerae bacterium]|nr:hypothetical protein [Phycisphaerae bacterium]|tara:strand:+ start:1399 stop:2271 length:873 start_codon:yes stop_codon:yes gene_type:complete